MIYAGVKRVDKIIGASNPLLTTNTIHIDDMFLKYIMIRICV